MGNFGGTLTARSAGDLRGHMQATGFAGADEAEVLGDGWQECEFDESGPRGLADLVRLTGAPAVLVAFLDSDVGFVEAATPDGASWEGLLNRGKAEDYEIPLEQFPVESAVKGALTWSAAAGLTADEALVRKALTGSALFAEELASLLSTALGIPGQG
ncbi:hypothetical protein ACFWFI_13145 [Streptomyces sp. NPDC060209]|uniref:hypothetical protein n=1 Tax=Streptomyces sp. NPDC060209 TaxID=3347073 RepID=UPI003662F74D